jgi:hypothetical protein
MIIIIKNIKSYYSLCRHNEKYHSNSKLLNITNIPTTIISLSIGTYFNGKISKSKLDIK